jgi:thiamine biosynthesis protein ThiI
MVVLFMFSPNCVVLLPFSEIFLKSSAVRAFMLKKLKKNVLLCLKHFGFKVMVINLSSRFVIESKEPEKVISSLKNCFGLHSLCVAEKKDFSSLENLCSFVPFLCEKKFSDESFAVRGKSFNPKFSSKDLENALGSAVLASFPKMKVNLGSPEKELFCLVIKNTAYFYFGSLPGAGGMPAGVQGKAGIVVGKDFNEKDLFFVSKNLLRSGCSVVFVSDKEISLSKTVSNELFSFSSFTSIKTVSLKEAKEFFSSGKLTSFFSLAKSAERVENDSGLLGVKCFAPLLF